MLTGRPPPEGAAPPLGSPLRVILIPLEFWHGLIGGATPEGFEIPEDQGPGRVVQCLKGSDLSSIVAFLGSLPSESASLSIGEAARALPQGVQSPWVLGWTG